MFTLFENENNKSADIIDLILDDHTALKELITIMKDSDKSLSDRRRAFERFGPLLLNHAKPEQQVLYVRMKKDSELREEGFEGDVEHSLAEQILKEAANTDDKDLFSARVKVLAELVEHHIQEEENELLPDFRSSSELEEREVMGIQYMELKDAMKTQRKPAGRKSRHESPIAYH